MPTLNNGETVIKLVSLEGPASVGPFAGRCPGPTKGDALAKGLSLPRTQRGQYCTRSIPLQKCVQSLLWKAAGSREYRGGAASPNHPPRRGILSPWPSASGHAGQRPSLLQDLRADLPRLMAPSACSSSTLLPLQGNLYARRHEASTPLPSRE